MFNRGNFKNPQGWVAKQWLVAKYGPTLGIYRGAHIGICYMDEGWKRVKLTKPIYPTASEAYITLYNQEVQQDGNDPM